MEECGRSGRDAGGQELTADLPPAVRIHGIEEARIPLAVARHLGVPMTLVSAPGAAGHAGAGWWTALVAILREEYPDVAFVAVLDCGQAPGQVLAAIRAGCADIAFNGPDDVTARLDDIAAQAGSRLHRPIGRVLDLRGIRRSRDAVTAWLTGVPASG